jgi:hypothetical protein
MLTVGLKFDTSAIKRRMWGGGLKFPPPDVHLLRYARKLYKKIHHFSALKRIDGIVYQAGFSFIRENILKRIGFAHRVYFYYRV